MTKHRPNHSKNSKRRFGQSKKTVKFPERTGNKVGSFVNIKDFGFPQRYACKLKYTASVILAGTGTTSQQVYRLNSLYDPDVAVGGTQPMCYDQLSAVYNKYLVTSAKYEVQFTNLNSTAVSVVSVPTDLSLSGSSFDSITEQKYAKNSVLSINSGGRSTVTHRGSISMARLMGQPELDSDPDMYSDVTTSPQDSAYLTLEAADFTGATSISVAARTKIVFYCVFKEYNVPNDSLFSASSKREQSSKQVAVEEKEPLDSEFESDLSIVAEFENVSIKETSPQDQKVTRVLANRKPLLTHRPSVPLPSYPTYRKL